jgi:serine/threonine protein kinase
MRSLGFGRSPSGEDMPDGYHDPRTLAKRSPQGSAPPLMRTGTFLGSLRHVSPEQARGEVGVDRRTELWSPGVTLHRPLPGATPFGPVGSSEDFIVEPVRATAPRVAPAGARANGASIRAAMLVPARVEEEPWGR